jgi:hypothetical protein
LTILSTAGRYNKLVQYGRESASLDVYAQATTPSLGRSTRPSAGPERSQLLRILLSLTVRQFFSVSTYFFLCQDLPAPKFLYAPIICRRLGFCVHLYFVDAQVFVCTYILLTPKFLYAPMFCQCLSFCCANILLTPKIC